MCKTVKNASISHFPAWLEISFPGNGTETLKLHSWNSGLETDLVSGIPGNCGKWEFLAQIKTNPNEVFFFLNS